MKPNVVTQNELDEAIAAYVDSVDKGIIGSSKYPKALRTMFSEFQHARNAALEEAAALMDRTGLPDASEAIRNLKTAL